MSAIRFQSKNKIVSVRGSERAYATTLMNKLTDVFLDVDWNQELILSAIPSGHMLQQYRDLPEWSHLFKSSFHFGDFMLEVGGKEVGSFLLGLNTATAIGDDSLKLLARIHAQCELHGYVAGKNRHWMAKIIEDAPVEVFRSDSGWEKLVDFLKESDEDPVVMSYSVTGDFVSSTMDTFIHDDLVAQGIDNYDEEKHEANWEIAEEKWNSLGFDERWNTAVEILLRTPEKGLEMTPDSWPIALGYDEMTAGKLIEELQQNAKMSS